MLLQMDRPWSTLTYHQTNVLEPPLLKFRITSILSSNWCKDIEIWWLKLSLVKKTWFFFSFCTSQLLAKTAPVLKHIALLAGCYWSTVSTSHVCSEAGLGRPRPKPPAGPPKFRYLHFTGLSGPKIVISPSSENADFEWISSILLSMDRPWSSLNYY